MDEQLSSVTRPDRRRPGRAAVVSIALMVVGLLGILLTWFLLSLLNDATDHGETVPSVFFVLSYLQFAVSAAQIVSGVFVWTGRQPWARILAIVVCSLNLVGGVVSLFSGNCLPGIFNVSLNIGLIAGLRDEAVYDWCHPYDE